MQRPLLTPAAALRELSVSQPDKEIFRWISRNNDKRESFTYFELNRHVSAVATHLHEFGVSVNDTVLLVYPPGLEFIIAFLGCIRFGCVAVPVYPPSPSTSHRFIKDLEKLHKIAENCGSRFMLSSKKYRVTFQAALLKAKLFHDDASKLLSDVKIYETSSLHLGPDYTHCPKMQNDLCFIQYTSGSTGEPKGVMITYGAFHCNMELAIKTYEIDNSSSVCSWLPQFHDMGLACYISMIYAGASGWYFSPLDFISNPSLWLELITEQKSTHMMAPNFAYELCVKKAFPNSDLDLSSVRRATTGAEPVRLATLKAFTEKFGPFGFNKFALRPSYGLAESCVFVMESPVVDSDVWVTDKGRVSCGVPSSSVDVRIVDPETHRELRDGKEGEIWIHSDSIAAGYFNNEALTERMFGAKLKSGEASERTYLRTGDMGFKSKGHFFISGRLKELIIVNGRNIIPSDLEFHIETKFKSLIRAGCSCGFAIDGNNTEEIGFIAELKDKKIPKDALALLSNEIRHEAMELIQQRITLLVFVPPRSIPKTSSGKIRRLACKELTASDRKEFLYYSDLRLESSSKPSLTRTTSTPLKRISLQVRQTASQIFSSKKKSEPGASTSGGMVVGRKSSKRVSGAKASDEVCASPTTMNPEETRLESGEKSKVKPSRAASVDSPMRRVSIKMRKTASQLMSPKNKRPETPVISHSGAESEAGSDDNTVKDHSTTLTPRLSPTTLTPRLSSVTLTPKLASEALDSDVSAPPQSEFSNMVRMLPNHLRLERVQKMLETRISNIVNSDLLPRGGINQSTTFEELGIDSILAVSLKSAVESELGAEISPTAFAKYDSVGEFSKFLVEVILGRNFGEGTATEEDLSSHFRRFALHDPESNTWDESSNLMEVKELWNQGNSNLREVAFNTLRNPLFSPLRTLMISTSEHRHLTFERIKCIFEMLKSSNYTTDQLNDIAMAFYECMAVCDLSVVLKFGVHVVLFGQTVKRLGNKQQIEWINNELFGCTVMGGLAWTEMGHGSNATQIQTRAKWDPAKRVFVISTPSAMDQKAWIGNAAVHGTHMVVVAKLITVDERRVERDHGPHGFLVQIRSEVAGAVLEGIQITDSGQKIGLNGVDNGKIYFSNVVVSENSLLAPQVSFDENGEYCADGDESPLVSLMGTLKFGRLGVSVASLSASKLGLIIALKYSQSRKQFGVGNAEVLLLNYRVHQQRLLGPLATNFGLSVALRVLLDAYREKENHFTMLDLDFTMLSSAIKVLCTDHAFSALQISRECLGAQGIASVNQIGNLKADIDGFITLEGDNTVLLIFLGTHIVNRALGHSIHVQKFDNVESLSYTPEAILNILQTCENYLMVHTIDAIRQRTDEDWSLTDAMLDCQHLILDVGRIAADRTMLALSLSKLNLEGKAENEYLLKDTLIQLFSLNLLMKNFDKTHVIGMQLEKRFEVMEKIADICLYLSLHVENLIPLMDIPDDIITASVASNWVTDNDWSSRSVSQIVTRKVRSTEFVSADELSSESAMTIVDRDAWAVEDFKSSPRIGLLTESSKEKVSDVSVEWPASQTVVKRHEDVELHLMKRIAPFAQLIEKDSLHGNLLTVPNSSYSSGQVNSKGRQLILLGSGGNYHGMCDEPRVKAKAMDAIQRFGIAATGAPAVAGTSVEANLLEKELAEFMTAEEVCLFSSGYSANLGTISALMGPGDFIFYEHGVHKSIIDGCRLSGAPHKSFARNNLQDLESLLIKTGSTKMRMIISESVFSVEGDMSDVPGLIAMAKKHNCLLLIDDAHGFGIIGETGRGVGEYFNSCEDILIRTGSLCKAFGGYGGWVASKHKIIQHIRYTAGTRAYSHAISPDCAAGVRESLRILKTEPFRVQKLRDDTQFVDEYLKSRGFNVFVGHGWGEGKKRQNGFVTIELDNDDIMLEFVKKIREMGVVVHPYPQSSGSSLQSRVRILAGSVFRREKLTSALEIICTVARGLNIIS
ncbi:hypothetical protein HK098_002103 [Nowakowskiella sp. JEL0407]|nr:hypothetical protein HK098_002103 [Nowakowskiella sp. JEL0407]